MKITVLLSIIKHNLLCQIIYHNEIKNHLMSDKKIFKNKYYYIIAYNKIRRKFQGF